VLIGDAETGVRLRIARLLGRCGPACRVVATVGNGCDVVDVCETDAVDLVLMETRLPGMDGLEAAAALAESRRPPAVVFVSADPGHALAAFDVGAVDYLIKPVGPTRLRRALERARRHCPEAGAGMGRHFVTASQQGGRLRIAADEISVLRADSKYVEVLHAGGVALTDESLRAIEQRIPNGFLRVHRNALVAEARIRALRRGRDGRLLLTVQGCDVPVEVSRRHASRVKGVLRGRVAEAPAHAAG
jgi:two-component system response regulator AlgR